MQVALKQTVPRNESAVFVSGGLVLTPRGRSMLQENEQDWQWQGLYAGGVILHAHELVSKQ